MKKNNKLQIEQLFKDFDYQKYWSDWDKEHPNQSKEYDFGKPVGKEIW